jgi:capsular exopolysaccharide synthesis family protein
MKSIPTKIVASPLDADPHETAFLEFDFRALLRALRRRLGIILSITIGGTFLALVAVLQITPLHTAQSLVFIDRQKAQVVDFQAVISEGAGDSAGVESEVEILRSRTVIRRVVEKLNLVDDPEFNGQLRPAPFIRINPIGWLKSLMGTTALVPVDEAQRRERVLNSVISAVLSRSDISRRGVTYVIEVNFTSENPEKAARIANEIADSYVLDQLEARFDATKQATEWLAQRLEGLRVQVRDSERAAEIFRTANGLQSSSGTTINEQQLSELNAQLILARANLAEKQAIASRARQIQMTGGSIETVAGVLQSATISGLRQKQAELAREQADLSSKYGPRHPSIVNIDAQRRDLEHQIGNEITRIVGSIANEAAVARSRVDALQDSLDQLRGRAGTDNQASVQLRELERVAAANRSVYEAFLNRYGETSTTQDLKATDARVITRATRPVQASYPQVSLFTSIAFMVSLLAGVGIALLIEQLDNGVKTGQDVEAVLRVACLGSVPAIPKAGAAAAREHVLKKPLSAFSESLRGLRSALALSNVDNPPKIVLFTSALPDEGKTTTAVSFAHSAAMAGQRTLLIDCDLRHPSVHKSFAKATPTVGIVELLAGRVTLEEVLFKDVESGVEVLPVASGSANPADLLGSGQMQKLLAQVRQIYDFVVLDSAPILPVSDSRVLSRMADKTIFVVRWTNTPREAAQNAIKLLRYYEADIAGAVLTVVDMTKQAKYGYGDGGYYYGRYSRYYAN